MPASKKTGPVELLRELVGLSSVSSTSPSWDQGNRAVIDLLAERLRDLGFAVEILPLPGKDNKANLIATLGSGPGGLVLSGHTDTVPYDDGRWSSDPMVLTEREQRLYGLGATDMKGFFPLVLEAAGTFRDQPLQHPLIVLATADEESSMSGAQALVAAGRPRARFAIIGEPTSLVPVRLHKGIMMEAVAITGQSGHSSDPALGRNALEGLHAVLGELLTYRAELEQRYQHPGFAVQHPTLNLGCVHGGDSPNRICGSAELHFDLRGTPGLDNQATREEISARLARLGERTGLDITLKSLIEGANPFEEKADGELVRLAEKLTGHRAEAVAFATEAPYLQALGMQTIVMGPGSIDRAHQPDEYIELEQFQPCIDLLEQFIAHCCL